MSYAFTQVASQRSTNVPAGRAENDEAAVVGPLEITYVRFWETAESTIGEFWYFENGQKVSGYFLEPPGPSSIDRGSDLRIPEGTYNINAHNGTRFRNHFRLDGVPGGPGPIVIHAGNSARDTEGCLLPGQRRGLNAVQGSRPMLEVLNGSLRGNSGASITIDRGFRGGFE